MYRSCLIVTALLFAAFCIIVYVRKVLLCKKTRCTGETPDVSLLLLIKNQQNTIEGLIREIFAKKAYQTFELIAVDMSSVDQTRQILELLARENQTVRIAAVGEGQTASTKLYDLCQGTTIYCFDLTDCFNFSLMAQTIHYVLQGSGLSLYRTRVIRRSEHTGNDKGMR